MDYIFAVARIRYKEMSLLTSQFLERLIACETYKECIALLNEKGWGDADGSSDANAILSAERDKAWVYIAELVQDTSVFDVFKYANDFHNLKAALKRVYTNSDIENIFNVNNTVDPELMLTAVREQNYELLPERMRFAAQQAFNELTMNGDGQMCDMIIDKAALEAIRDAGQKADNEVIPMYAEITVASANIKIAVRAAKMSKSYDFIKNALAECETLDINALAEAAAKGFEAICDYLSTTVYSNAVSALKISPSAFECWCDNHIIESIRPQRYQSDTIGPIIAYMIAKENEIKVVRIILSGKLNGLKTESVRERLREMYV